MALNYPFSVVGTPPTEQDVINFERVVDNLNERGVFDDRRFSEMLSTRPPTVIFNDPGVAKENRVVAAYYPDRNVITFKTGRTSEDAVKHEFFHAAQNFFLGGAYCQKNDCEPPAYAFETAFYKTGVLFMLARPRYDFRKDWFTVR